MEVLWARGQPSTAAEVRALLVGEPAYNTVQTILTRLHEKCLVLRRRLGRRHVYWPVEDAATTAAGRMRAALAERADRQAVLRRFAASLDDADARTLRHLLSAPDEVDGPAAT